MSSKFQKFLNFLGNQEFKTSNTKLKEALDKYIFHEIPENDDSKLHFEISRNLKESRVIVISHYKEQEKEVDRENYKVYFVVSFKRTILVINQTLINILQNFLSRKEKLEICFLSSTKSFFDRINDEIKETKIIYNEIKNSIYFEKEINELNSNFYIIKSRKLPHDDILLIIKSCISGYLIKESYFTYNRIENFNNEEKNQPREIKTNEVIKLRLIDAGSIFQAVLYYHIEYEKLVVIKKDYIEDSEKEKLLTREIQNYKSIRHPFIPKYYGTIKDGDLIYPVIEFINGNNLLKTDFSQFSETEIYEIILQILIVINYLHNNHFIYRDLKPDNIMIDENKTIILLDFDRMVKDDYKYDKNIGSAKFTKYADPEVNSNDITNKCDIYSIGKMIEFIKNQRKSMMKNYENRKLFQIYKNCINEKSYLRPNTSELIIDFILFIRYFINKNKVVDYFSLASNQNNPQAQYFLGLIYYEGKYISRDISKAIQYFSLAANQNHSEAQYNLGIIYYEGEHISQDINKSIYYFSLAANQNHSESQFNLGIFYYSGKYISQDINKAIYYFELAANQNHPKAQYNLGSIYEKGKYISRNINKAIYYYSLSANQNHSQAQYSLGLIFEEGKYISRDINKAIYYYSLAANQNHSIAQNNLGFIYLEGKYISRDINKSIYYFEKAADKNIPEAQFNLGLIYYLGQYISRDVNKAIYYFSHAANHNHLKAQFYLGLIYYEGKYIPQDIDKFIDYFSLAANQNHPEAQYVLGIIYYEGQYISRDINKSIHYYSLSANQNHIKAQYNLGLIYSEGKYISRDIKKAIYYFSLAANQNHPKAQFKLGLIYSEGKYISRDINKSIHYYSLAANQNYPDAQNNLGSIYYLGQYISRDINKAIHYYSLAANQNNSHAQYNLGLIFEEGKYISRDINKAIYYYSLAANQNIPEAQYNLGSIYYSDKYISRDINKSIHYYSLSANHNYSEAQYNLGLIYSEGKYISRDMNKAIYYYSLAANQNHPKAQFLLGLYYYFGYSIKKNINNGINWFIRSSENNCINAHFVLGFLFQEGKYVKRDMKKSIHHYKEASSFNNQYAKNNLGILYKHGIGVEANLESAQIFFNEAITQKDDPISMYNLAHIYLYEEDSIEFINKSIELLKKSSNKRFSYSTELLYIALCKKYEKNIDAIKNEYSKFLKYDNESELVKFIDNFSSEEIYFKYKEIDFLYDIGLKKVISKDIYKEKISPNPEIKLTKEFYEGFGIKLN